MLKTVLLAFGATVATAVPRQSDVLLLDLLEQHETDRDGYEQGTPLAIQWSPEIGEFTGVFGSTADNMASDVAPAGAYDGPDPVYSFRDGDFYPDTFDQAALDDDETWDLKLDDELNDEQFLDYYYPEAADEGPEGGPSPEDHHSLDSVFSFHDTPDSFDQAPLDDDESWDLKLDDELDDAEFLEYYYPTAKEETYGSALADGVMSFLEEATSLPSGDDAVDPTESQGGLENFMMDEVTSLEHDEAENFVLNKINSQQHDEDRADAATVIDAAPADIDNEEPSDSSMTDEMDMAELPAGEGDSTADIDTERDDAATAPMSLLLDDTSKF